MKTRSILSGVIFSAFITLVTAAGFPGSVAHAGDVIFSDFGPGNSYNADEGYAISGSSDWPIGYAAAAVLFKSSVTASVSQIAPGEQAAVTLPPLAPQSGREASRWPPGRR